MAPGGTDSKMDETNEIKQKTMMTEEQLRDEVKNSGYRVFRGKQDEAMEDENNDLEMVSDQMSTRDAFFSLMAIKMMNLSSKYGRKLEDLHDMFYTVSCDWDRLEKVLQDSAEQLQWTVLEDLAVRDERDSEAYRHVVESKGQEEVEKRRFFLEID